MMKEQMTTMRNYPCRDYRRLQMKMMRTKMKINKNFILVMEVIIAICMIVHLELVKMVDFW